MFKEYLNVIDQNTKDFFKKNVIENLNFPFYFNTSELQPVKTSFCFFSHTILNRPETKSPNPINSDLYPYAVALFKKLSKKCKFKYKKIFRICLNLTFNNGHKQSATHLDHKFKYKQLILYLHVDDLKSYTYIYNKKKTELIKVKPTPYKVITWGHTDHYHMVPKKGYRLVLVYTYI
jgi:hypothetical protein